MLLNESTGYRIEGLPHNQNLFSSTRPNELKFPKDVASYDRQGPLVWKTRNSFGNVAVKRISDFQKRWGNSGPFDWFAAD